MVLSESKEAQMNRRLEIGGIAGYCGMLIISGSCSAGPIADDSQSSPTSSSSSLASHTSDEKKPARMDRDHPLKIGPQYYPVESKRLGENGWCLVRFQVDTDGFIRAAQLTSSTGFEHLDSACLTAVTDGHLLPATVDGKSVFDWPELPMAWFVGRPPARPRFNLFLVPKVRRDYQLKIGPDHYPAESREMHEEGDCTIHGFVKEDGTLINISVSRSTGFAALDQACISAVQQAPFVPAQANGTAIGAFFDINISWRLPTQ
jgi:TonB family protein